MNQKPSQHRALRHLTPDDHYQDKGPTWLEWAVGCAVLVTVIVMITLSRTCHRPSSAGTVMLGVAGLISRVNRCACGRPIDTPGCDRCCLCSKIPDSMTLKAAQDDFQRRRFLNVLLGRGRGKEREPTC